MAYSNIWQNRFLTTTIHDNEGHFIIFKGTIHKEDIKVLNTYVPSIGTFSIIKQILVDIKSQGNSSKVIIYVQTASLSSIDSLFGYKINRESLKLKWYYKVPN